MSRVQKEHDRNRATKKTHQPTQSGLLAMSNLLQVHSNDIGVSSGDASGACNPEALGKCGHFRIDLMSQSTWPILRIAFDTFGAPRNATSHHLIKASSRRKTALRQVTRKLRVHLRMNHDIRVSE
ncbi:uncharacterized protein MELLADRAFT_109072 [Melampsora larici-populina 98AG31]|uniref:Uncharacterized protein n=1 Tax=Melampsora larici-populina (strain 98AG31 / pathotype 3-4-7) TaxID=747676 RepID=F4RV85_MELLP|nr:uncharacterized protein MELLADRAFT_109072 [Melampsora larici-populina 98AG31]EGG03578.1 hypothetical protein MELLADRAFT_109072 [Melampsora larici-populina 98AG31]